MAEKEILGEAKKAAARHFTIGISGWQPCPKPNKVFLANTLLQTMASNRLLLEKKQRVKSESKTKIKERKLLRKNTRNECHVFKKPTGEQSLNKCSSEANTTEHKTSKSECNKKSKKLLKNKIELEAKKKKSKKS